MTSHPQPDLEPLDDIDARLENAQASVRTHLATGAASPQLAAVLAHLGVARRVLGEVRSREAEG